MRLTDGQIRRITGGLVLAGTGTVAYLHAAAFSQLAVDAVFPAEERIASHAAWPAAPERRQALSSKDAEPILSRNPFDSVTGPLNRKPGEPGADAGGGELAEAATRELDLSDPLAAPQCEDLHVHGTAEAVDPRWSTAIVQAPDDDRGKLRRPGDVVDGAELVYIGYNAAEASPAAWFVKEAELCQALVFSDEPRPNARSKKEKVKKRKAKPKKAKAKPKRKRKPPPVPKELASRVKRVGPNEYRIDRKVVDTMIAKGTKLVSHTRMVPDKKDGRVTGVRLSNVGSKSLLGTLGLKDGDRLKDINGFSVTSPEQALKAYAGLRNASDLTITIERGGKPVSLEYRIR